MNKDQAKRIIKETFEQPFDKKRFTPFIKNLLNRIEEDLIPQRQGKYIPEAYRQYISTFERIGKFNDGENRIDILIIKLQKETSLASARTMQRNFVAGYLQGKYGSSNEKEAALVAYVAPDEADWRFSLVKMDYKFEQAPTGKMKVEEEFTSARRWSFLVGENEKSHTAQSRLVNILANDDHNPTLAELEEAFNIESVTKEFFYKYRDLFIRTKEALDELVQNNSNIKADFEAKSINTVDFAKKLLGQIVFLYFLQKKGWFGVGRDAKWGTGSKKFLRELFEKKHSGYNNFFNDILEPLFYDALSRDRSDIDHWNDQFKCKIPFLNGGLFDPIGNYSWHKTDILLPDSLFSNKSKTKEGDEGDGILDIFDRYNFTVREDEPLEKEVAIDPELLGKTYEKFNAIRPDNFEEYKIALKSGKKGNESKFNKQYGVYYTPREIVHYMCQQSLINYLFTELNSDKISYEKLGDPNLEMFGNKGKKGQLDITIEHREKPLISKEDIEKFVHLGEQVSENEAIALIKEQRINTGIQKSTEKKLQLPESIRTNAELIDQKLTDITVCDPAVGSGAFPVGMMSEIVKARMFFVKTGYLEEEYTNTHDEKVKRTSYNFKRDCIEKSLYGVDIDPGAVEIAKLRLWLSLVVDEEDIKNIKPLPNLDYKIVCGNSLLGVQRTLENWKDFAGLEKLKPLYFNETNPTKKQEYKRQIDQLINQITNGHTEFDFEVYFSEVFHKKGGFDVVIANPPYGNLLEKKQKEVMKSSYFHSTFSDISSTFIEESFNLLKNRGHLVFIITFAIIFSKEFSKSRELIFNGFETALISSFDRDRCKIFKSMSQSVSIMRCFNKNSNNKKGIFSSRFFRDTPEIDKIIFSNCNNFLLPKNTKYNQKHRLPKLGEKINQQIITKLLSYRENIAKIIKNNGDKIWIRTSGNYWYNAFDRQPYKSSEIKPLFIQSEYNDFTILFINSSLFYFWFRIYGDGRHMNIDILENFPLPSKEKFQKYNILLRKVRIKFMDSLFSIFEKDRNRFITSEIKCEIDLLDLILGKYFYSLSYDEIKHILNYDSEIRRGIKLQKPFIDLINQILSLNQSEDYLQNPTKQANVKEYEKQIDQMVYQLYGLTEDEIKIVEGEK